MTVDLPSKYVDSSRWQGATHVGQLLLWAAREAPDRGIGYCAPDDVTATELCSYPDLLRQALRLRESMLEIGVTPGRIVALLLERPQDFLPAYWACMLGGFPACPLVPVRSDPQLWAAQLGHVNTLLDGPLVVTTGQLRDELPFVEGMAVAELERLAVGRSTAGSDDMPIHESRPEDLALLVLTSGSTGASKAVQLTHANLLASMAAKIECLDMTSSDVTLNWVSYDHVAALLEKHLMPLSVGAMQMHVVPDAVLANPLRFLELLDAHRVTATFTPNFLLGQINKLVDQQPAGLSLDLSSLKKIISGGEANPVATGTAFLDRMAPYGMHGGALWPAFGMTETCAGCIYNWEFPEADVDAEFAAVGRPVSGLRIRVAEDGTEAPLPDGEVGEVQLSGPMITRGYFNNKEATDAAFTMDGWFRTGDLGKLVNGRLTLVGRSKDSIIVNGVSYYGHDLETALNGLEGVEKSFVAAFPTRPKGSDTEQLAVAFATAAHINDDAKLYQLLVAIRNSVVLHWGFRPTVLLPLPKSEFPKTSLGKIQRTLMRRRLEAGEYAEYQISTEQLVTRQLGGYTAPEGESEEALAELYGMLFDMDPSAISARASFFDLGGTSLDILRLKRLLTKRFPGTDLPVLAVLTAPSIRELAQRIGAGQTAENRPYDPLVPLQTSGAKTPLFCVHPGVGEVLVFVNLAKYLVSERPFYALRARGFNPGEKPFETFAEMSRCYADAIRAKQPHGPYALAGYSFGSAVAFEIAKIFEAEGERVDFLGIFNLPPHIKTRMNELDFVETAVNLAMFLELISPQEAKGLAARLRPLSRDEQLKQVIALSSAERLTEVDLDLDRFEAWVDLAYGLTCLGQTYEPSGSVRRVSVFCAIPLKGTKEHWVEKELKRWDDFTREPNRYIDVPGEHYTMMGPKHVPVFQSVLRAELDRCLE
jgi:acyl-CoA synthetase (AMP-forming)/AMP-acid ligase II/thioesterase domain-containing protein